MADAVCNRGLSAPRFQGTVHDVQLLFVQLVCHDCLDQGSCAQKDLQERSI